VELSRGRRPSLARRAHSNRAGKKSLLKRVLSLSKTLRHRRYPTSTVRAIYTGGGPATMPALSALPRAAGFILLDDGKRRVRHRHPGPTTNPHECRLHAGPAPPAVRGGVADFMVPGRDRHPTGVSVIRPPPNCGSSGSSRAWALSPAHADQHRDPRPRSVIHGAARRRYRTVPGGGDGVPYIPPAMPETAPRLVPVPRPALGRRAAEGLAVLEAAADRLAAPAPVSARRVSARVRRGRR